MVAEKPSLALSIAKLLSNGKLNSRKSLSSACQVHEYYGNHNFLFYLQMNFIRMFIFFYLL